MSWAARRRLLYIVGLLIFFGVLIGGPIAYTVLTVPPTCSDGKVNQGETAPDKGGPCPDVDERALSPVSPLWTRSFLVRDGSYTSAAYIQNSNDQAGVADVSYIFKLYDSENVLVAEREGRMFIMPGGITPVIELNIDSGNRIVTHTFFEFTSPLRWQHYDDMSKTVRVSGREVSDASTLPRVQAQAVNTSVSTILNARFASVVFDTAGNAVAASLTEIDRLEPNVQRQIVFSWPTPFAVLTNRVDIIPLLPPKAAWVR